MVAPLSKEVEPVTYSHVTIKTIGLFLASFAQRLRAPHALVATEVTTSSGPSVFLATVRKMAFTAEDATTVVRSCFVRTASEVYHF